jgi:hypothetical protein
MDAEGFTEPEVGVAVAALAILGAPPVRRLLRRAFVLVAAGVLGASEALVQGARGLGDEIVEQSRR